MLNLAEFHWSVFRLPTSCPAIHGRIVWNLPEKELDSWWLIHTQMTRKFTLAFWLAKMFPLWNSSRRVSGADRQMDMQNKNEDTDKTQLIWMGTDQQLLKVNISEINLQDSTFRLSSNVCFCVCWGGLLDGQLRMSDHVAALCRTCFFPSSPDTLNETIIDIRRQARRHWWTRLCKNVNCKCNWYYLMARPSR